MNAPATTTTAVGDFAESLGLWRLWLHQGYADLLRRYRRTLLGPLWHTLSLGIFIVATGVIWAAIMKVDLPRYMVFLSAGLVVWGLISSSVLEGASTLIAAQPLVLSMRIPYPMLAMGLIWRLFLVFLHQLPLCAAAALYFGNGALSAGTLMLIPATAVVCVSGVWMALLAGLLTLRFRDASAILGSLMHIAMFATPIFWSKDLLGPELAHLADWNPLFHLVEIMRAPILGETATMKSWLLALGWMAGGLLLTMWVYARVRNRIAYWY
jgi:ABC-type polysaccharide/polyol phosphate export permease